MVCFLFSSSKFIPVGNRRGTLKVGNQSRTTSHTQNISKQALNKFKSHERVNPIQALLSFYPRRFH